MTEPLAVVAALLAPADAPERRPPVIAPRSASVGLAPTVAHAAGREAWLLRLRVRGAGPLRVRRVHRFAPPSVRAPGIAQLIRAVLLGGAVPEMRPPRSAERLVLDDVLAAAAVSAAGALRVGAGGGVLLPVMAGDQPAMLRAGVAGTASDPLDAAVALDAAGGHPMLPKPLRRGRTGDVAWTTETRLPGRRPRRMTDELAVAALAVVSSLPREPTPPRSFAEDVQRIAAAVPAEALALNALSTAFAPALASLPSVTRHGDLWAGNLLADGSGLRGLVDWDAWHPAAVPGTDAMQLLSGELRGRRGHTLGTAFAARPWEDERHARVTAGYWQTIGVRPRGDEVVAIAAAWWATEVAGTLARTNRARDDAWLDANVRRVLAVLGF